MNPTGPRAHLLLFTRFLRNPNSVGAIAPSSRTLARHMVAGLDLSGPVHVVELGPGTGAFTRAIVERLGPGGRFLAIEVEPKFVKRVQHQWPNVECVCASAAALPVLAAERGLLPVDHVISGLPFASLPRLVTEDVLDGIERALRPGGTFTTFQYLHAYRLASAGLFRRQMAARLGPPVVRRLIFRNLPPAFVLRWRRTY